MQEVGEKEWSLGRTIIRILWGRFVLSLEFLHHLVYHFSCDVVMTRVNKPDARRSTSTAPSLSRHLCQETPGLRDSKAHSLSGFCLLVCVASDCGHNLLLSLLSAALRLSSLPGRYDTGSKTFFYIC